MIAYKENRILVMLHKLGQESLHSFIIPTDAHNYKIIGILKQLKFRQLLQHVSVHEGTITRELFRAWLKLQLWFYCACR